MATKKKTKKKTTKKISAKRAHRTEVAEPMRAYVELDSVRVGTAIETLRNAVNYYRDAITELEDDGELPQELIAIASFAQLGKGSLRDIAELFEVNAIRIKEGGGCFEDGDLRVDFEVQKGSKRVKWKDLALANRKELTEEQGGEFDSSAYEKLLSANTKPTPDKIKPVIRTVL